MTHHVNHQPGTARPRRTSGALLLVLAWIIALTAITCSAKPAPVPVSATHPMPDGLTRTEPVPPAPVTNEELGRLPEATTFTTIEAAPRDPEPHAPTTGLLVRPRRAAAVYDSPGGEAIAALPPTQLGGPTWLPVIERQAGWLRVLLPTRPNRATGWLHDTRDLRLARSRYTVIVDRTKFTLALHRDGKRVGTWRVGVGKPATATPAGRTFILAALRDRASAFSDIVLPLGAHSDTYTSYGGGPGTVGIHTWPGSNVYGRASSDGCVRVPRDALTELSTTVPIGTPVLIR